MQAALGNNSRHVACSREILRCSNRLKQRSAGWFDLPRLWRIGDRAG